MSEVTTSAVPSQAPVPRKRRRWPYVLLSLVILLVLVVLLLPTIVSTGIVRSLILPRASSAALAHPNAKLDIASWSFGWFGGQSISGIRITDADQIVAIDASVRTDLSLLSAIRGDYDLGNTVIDADIVRLKIEADGSSNLQRTFVTSASSTPSTPTGSSADIPIELPNVKGRIVINLTGTIEPPAIAGKAVAPIKIEKGSTILIDLLDPEKDIGLEGKLVYQTQGKISTVDFKAHADAVDKGIIKTDPTKLSARADVTLSSIDLSVLNAVLAPLGIPVNRIEGVVNGQATLDLKPGLNASIDSDLTATQFLLDTPHLNGDILRLAEVKLPASVKRQGEKIVITNTGIRSRLVNIDISGEIDQIAASNLASGLAPAGTGKLKIATTGVDLKTLASQFPSTMKLLPDVEIEGGAFENTAGVDIKPEGVSVGQLTKLQGVRGTNDGRAISLDDTTFQASAFIPSGDGKLQVEQVKDVVLNLASPLATVKGSGAIDAFNITAEADLDKLQSQVAQFVDIEALVGKLTLSGKVDFAMKTTGNPFESAKTFRVDAGLNTRGITVTLNDRKLLENETLRTQFIADIEQNTDITKLSISRLNVTSSSKLLDVQKQGDSPMIVTLAAGKLPVGTGTISGSADVARLSAIAAPDADPSTRVKRGTAQFTLAFDTNSEKKQYEIRTDAVLSNLDVGDAIKGENVQLISRVFTPEDFSRITAWADVVSGFGNVKLADVDVRLTDTKGKPVAALSMLRAANFSGSIQSIAKVNALVAGMSPVDKTIAPLIINSGSLTFGGKAGYDEKAGLLAIDFDVPGVEKLSMSRGDVRFTPEKPMTLALSVEIRSDASQVDLAKALKDVKVTRLEGDLFGEGRFKMIEPIVITDPAGNPKAQGAVDATARLDFISDLLEVATSGAPIGVLGNVSFTQRLKTEGSAIALVGEVSFTKLRSREKGASPFPSDRLRMDNDLRLDLVKDTVGIAKLRVFTPDNDSLELVAAGTVNQFSTERVMKDVALDLSYDLEQLWPILGPMMDPTGESLGRGVVAKGKYKKRFDVSGKFPAVVNGRPAEFGESIRFLSASGEITVDQFEAPDKGLWMQQANLPVTIEKGILTLSSSGKDAAPIALNKGEMSLGKIVVDLTRPVPTISIRRDTQFLKDVELNPQMASSFGKYASVLFSNTEKAFGIVNLKIRQFDNVPSDLVSARGDQKGVMELSIEQLYLDGMIPGLLSQALDLGTDGLRGHIRGSVLELKDGTSVSDLTITLERKETVTDDRGRQLERIVELPLRFAGRIDLKTFSLKNTQIEFPTSLIKARDLQRFLGPTLIVPIKGSLDNPQFDIGRAIQQNAQQGLIPGLLDGLTKPKNNR